MIFKYNVIFFDEDNKNDLEICGITFGKNFEEAMKNLEEYYGNELIEVKIKYHSYNNNIVEIKKDYCLDDILEEVY